MPKPPRTHKPADPSNLTFDFVTHALPQPSAPSPQQSKMPPLTLPDAAHENNAPWSSHPTQTTTHPRPPIPQGYKQTEVGIIPQDWEVTTIFDIAQVVTGSKNTQDRTNEGKYPFFVRSSTVERIDSFSYDGEAVLTAGDGVGTGKVFHYINGKFDVHQRVYRISNFQTNVKGYYFYLYFSVFFYERIMKMTAKSSVDSVRLEMITRMPIPLPPLEEQEAIAEALSDADALVDALERLLWKKRRLKEGAMQELLTGRTRLPGFSGAWETKRLGEIGVFLKGSGVSKSQAQGGTLPCVRYGELYTRHNNLIKKFYSWISPEVASQATPLKKGDVLFAGSGETKEEIGKSAAYLEDKEAYAGGDLLIFRSCKADSAYLGYYLNHPTIVHQKSRRGQGDAIVHINANALSSIEGNFPPMEEQEAIAEVLYEMDEEIEALEEKLAKARQIKQGMMQELLTGRIRLR